MPVHVDSEQSSYGSQRSEKWPRHTRPSQRREESSRCVTIGLINNMPQAAFTATERQFISVLDAASEDIEVRLSLYSLLDIPKPSTGRHRAAAIRALTSSGKRTWMLLS